MFFFKYFSDHLFDAAHLRHAVCLLQIFVSQAARQERFAVIVGSVGCATPIMLGHGRGDFTFFSVALHSSSSFIALFNFARFFC